RHAVDDLGLLGRPVARVVHRRPAVAGGLGAGERRYAGEDARRKSKGAREAMSQRLRHSLFRTPAELADGLALKELARLSKEVRPNNLGPPRHASCVASACRYRSKRFGSDNSFPPSTPPVLDTRC